MNKNIKYYLLPALTIVLGILFFTIYRGEFNNFFTFLIAIVALGIPSIINSIILYNTNQSKAASISLIIGLLPTLIAIGFAIYGAFSLINGIKTGL